MSSTLSTWFGVGRWPNSCRSPKTDEAGSLGGYRSRFEGEGLVFRAKLIGKQPVPDARGHGLCQDAMSRLKEAVRASGQRKQRVQLTVSLQGIKTRGEKTRVLLYHHLVHPISFILQDTSDARAAGYIYAARDDSYHYIAIKT
ncbi:disabled homolog 1-like [Amblyomma americanum]